MSLASASLPVLRDAEIAREGADRFVQALRASGVDELVRGEVTTLQVNIGKRCNQACHHCHVEAGPKRTEIMERRVVDRVIEVLARSPRVELLDVTGGAPELNPHFRRLVTEAHRLGRRVVDRCNLTVLLEPGMEDLPELFASLGVRVVASLPCYQPGNVDEQRGRGVFHRSIEALRRLARVGYAAPGSGLELDLVYNPLGASLPPDQATLERRYKQELKDRHGVEFNRLLTITNMPIRRFAHQLQRTNQHEAYMSLLVNHFNERTLPGLMCRSLVSVGWDGRLYDCDFNQMLDLPIGAGRETIFDLDDLAPLSGLRVSVGSHCFGCTAGAGSSCGGALDEGGAP